MDLVCKADSSAGFPLLLLNSLLDRCEARFFNVEVAVDVGALTRRVRVPLLVKCGHCEIDLLPVSLSAFLLQLAKSAHFGNLLGEVMLGVSISDREEVVVVDDDATLLHYAEGTFCSRLLHVPHDFVVDSLPMRVIAVKDWQERERECA